MIVETSSQKRPPLCLCILDGWGHAEASENNAISLAKTPHMDQLFKKSFALLDASGPAVGLPKSQFGNSEVGHMTIGSGRVILQDLERIQKELTEDQKKKTLKAWIETLAKDSHIHIVGLASEGGVHSHIDHLKSLISIIQECSNKEIILHAITDGRDTAPDIAHTSLSELEPYLREKSVKISTVSGRFYAMDRDNRWERTNQYIDVLTNQTSQLTDFKDHLQESYNKAVYDEFIPPAALLDHHPLQTNDGVLFFNFRADRMIQLVQALTNRSFPHFKQPIILSPSQIMTLTPYPKTDVKIQVLCPPEPVKQTLSDCLHDADFIQHRIAETEKYAHVTYFFNGGSDKKYENEHHHLIHSPKVETYDLTPRMSCDQITDTITKLHIPDNTVIICNYANADMVGHTGKMPQTIEAIEALDECIGRLVRWSEENRVDLMITADHGNADEMIDQLSNTPKTSHSEAPVPFITVSSRNYTMNKTGSLADIAPTILDWLSLPIPSIMTGVSLYQSNSRKTNNDENNDND